MTTLVVGATGATGRLLVQQLLDRGETVKAIVRSPEKLVELQGNKNLSLIQASLLDLSDQELAQHVQGCEAVASCLGHNLTMRRIYGRPRKLVTEAARRLCQAVKANNPSHSVKYVLMNTTGNSNRDIPERISFAETAVLSILRLLLPPQVDNEQAADYLRVKIGQNDPVIEWVAVRPDSLINQDVVTEYDIYPSPIRSAVFNAGKTSRINVGHFMAELITNADTWATWKGKMPVIYNKEIT
ncbi:MAG: SDR family oxidoreductase [Anaerolineae bacterium]|nr:SDR family oxidoreductase [Anaerolineae bacterium]